MSTIKLFTGNRLENLSKALAKVLSSPLPNPLAPELFVVQSNGMARWIAMEIARQTGISANFRFLYPNEFIHSIFKHILPHLPDRTIYDPDILTWRIIGLLPECLSRPGFELLKAYVGDDGITQKNYQLAARIADLFDQYLLYRPDMIFGWERGEKDHWQAQLWREIVEMRFMITGLLCSEK